MHLHKPKSKPSERQYPSQSRYWRVHRNYHRWWHHMLLSQGYLPHRPFANLSMAWKARKIVDSITICFGNKRYLQTFFFFFWTQRWFGFDDSESTKIFFFFSIRLLNTETLAFFFSFFQGQRWILPSGCFIHLWEGFRTMGKIHCFDEVGYHVLVLQCRVPQIGCSVLVVQFQVLHSLLWPRELTWACTSGIQNLEY